MTWTGEGERARAVERRDRNGLVMFVDQGLRFFFAKPDGETERYAKAVNE
jgi:hypothetical protein